jgi:hypothetical protein
LLDLFEAVIMGHSVICVISMSYQNISFHI